MFCRIESVTVGVSASHAYTGVSRGCVMKNLQRHLRIPPPFVHIVVIRSDGISEVFPSVD